MSRPRFKSLRKAPPRSARPALEHLEGRILLYSTLGAQWTYSSRITYSFMPDGTSVGGVPSALFQTLNAVAPTATWEAQFEQAASIWENAANLNLAPVPDGGQPLGVSGDQQDDPRFGDIRIGAVPLDPGVLAVTFVPPPINGGSDAGDILFNSNANWAINNTYDVMTVAAHEFGHALGLGESTVVGSVMYGTYEGIVQSLISDDIAGIQSIYGAPQYDSFNSNGSHNGSVFTAANITSDITSAGQIALANLDLTVPGQAEWFSVTVPSSTTGKMTVTVQSSNLSSLEPGLMIYNQFAHLLAQTSAATPGGATISLTMSVQAGQKYYIKDVAAVSGTAGTVGAYGLLVNFGNQTQSPIPPPNTVVPQQPDEGGGTITNVIGPAGSSAAGSSRSLQEAPGVVRATIGGLTSWVAQMEAKSGPMGVAPIPVGTASRLRATRSPDLEGGWMGVLPSFSTTATAPSGMGVHSDSSTGRQAAPVAAPQPVLDVVFQAVDAVLEQSHGHHRRSANRRSHGR
jgi:hypothetical protein